MEKPDGRTAAASPEPTATAPVPDAALLDR